jgi:hypothetical protein
VAKIVVIIRYLLSLGLVYGVYTETGIFTALAIFAIFIGFEIVSMGVKRG